MKTKLLVFLSITLLSACSKTRPPEPEETAEDVSTITLTEAQIKAAKITVGRIEEKDVANTFEVNGMLDVPPQNVAVVAAPMGGFLKYTKLLEGMQVRKGEVIATLENQDYIQLQQDYLDNRSKLDFLEAEYARQQALAEEKINAGKALQQAKAQYESTRAIVKGLEARLSMINLSTQSVRLGDIRSTINIYAPISGYVTQVNVSIGQFVNSADVMFKILNPDHIHAELHVFEKDVHLLKEGQLVTFRLASDTTERDAKVYLIGKEISQDRTVRVHCHLAKEEDPALVPGMYITARISGSTSRQFVVPSSAVVTFDGSTFVFTQDDQGKFTMLPVEANVTFGDYSVLATSDPLIIQKPIVTSGAFALLSMMKNTEEEE